MNKTKQPVVSRKTYVLVFLGLLALTLLTVLVGRIDMGPFSMVAAIAIASTKASLIAVYFMHALYGTKVVRVVVVGGLLWFLILLSLTLMDYGTRVQG